MDQWRVIRTGPDGKVTTYGTVTDREFAERILKYAQSVSEDGDVVELQRRDAPLPSTPIWETVSKC